MRSPIHSSLLAHADAPTLAGRWNRLRLGVRCAYNPGQPAVIRQYVVLGTQLARSRLLSSQVVFQSMLALLLKAAADPALPWPWRSQCLEHSAWPMARLTTLLARSDAAALADWLAQWQAAQDALAIGSTGRARESGETGETGQTGETGETGLTGLTTSSFGATGGDA